MMDDPFAWSVARGILIFAVAWKVLGMFKRLLTNVYYHLKGNLK